MRSARTLWNLLVYTGMRPGAALALQWSDVDLSAGVLRVRRALVPQKKDAGGRTWRLEDTKTDKSRRAIPLLPITIEALRRQWLAQRADQLVAGAGYRDHGFVFANSLGDPLRGDVLYKSHFLPALRAAGVPTVTLYALRHTAATLLLEAGVPMKVVQERLGHSTMMLTADTYSHVSASLQARAVEELARYVDER
jgi:integrase